jgi:hypothetical protein
VEGTDQRLASPEMSAVGIKMITGLAAWPFAAEKLSAP